MTTETLTDYTVTVRFSIGAPNMDTAMNGTLDGISRVMRGAIIDISASVVKAKKPRAAHAAEASK